MAANKTGEEKKIKNKTKPVKGATKKKKQKESTSILDNKPKRKVYDNKLKLRTHTGHKLTSLEAKFIQLYVEIGSGQHAVEEAGYKSNNPRQYAQLLLTKPYIAEEITWRLEQFKKTSIATAEEIMEFYTKVMRGEEKDQFGLDAPLGERIKAGNELAKRLVDIPNKLEGKAQATVTVSLDFTGMEEDNDNKDDQNEEN